MAALLEVRNLTGLFETFEGPVNALKGVDLTIDQGRVTGLVGETGSGKSATVSLLVGVQAANFRVTGGEITFGGVDLLKLTEQEFRKVRGSRISIAFQDPRSSLNPVITVGEQLTRVARLHNGISWEEAKQRSLEMLAKVQISEPLRRYRQYPHEMSGGMAQRVMIAMALLPSPELLILDEPTTGLDVTVQAEILELLRVTVRESGLTALLISHDLAVVSEICDDVAVMYAGRIVETGTAREIFEHPSHPYTRELARAAQSLDASAARKVAEGQARRFTGGCPFLGRCPISTAECAVEPEPVQVDLGHYSRCHYAHRLHANGATVDEAVRV